MNELDKRGWSLFYQVMHAEVLHWGELADKNLYYAAMENLTRWALAPCPTVRNTVGLGYQRRQLVELVSIALQFYVRQGLPESLYMHHIEQVTRGNVVESMNQSMTVEQLGLLHLKAMASDAYVTPSLMALVREVGFTPSLMAAHKALRVAYKSVQEDEGARAELSAWGMDYVRVDAMALKLEGLQLADADLLIEAAHELWLKMLGAVPSDAGVLHA